MPLLNLLQKGRTIRMLRGHPGSCYRIWAKKIDVNAFAMETYWQDVACCFASDELHLVYALA